MNSVVLWDRCWRKPSKDYDIADGPHPIPWNCHVNSAFDEVGWGVGNEDVSTAPRVGFDDRIVDGSE